MVEIIKNGHKFFAAPPIKKLSLLIHLLESKLVTGLALANGILANNDVNKSLRFSFSHCWEYFHYHVKKLSIGYWRMRDPVDREAPAIPTVSAIPTEAPDI